MEDSRKSGVRYPGLAAKGIILTALFGTASTQFVPVWLAMKEVSVSSVLSVWLKRAMGLAPWNSRMLGTATVPNLVERLVGGR